MSRFKVKVLEHNTCQEYTVTADNRLLAIQKAIDAATGENTETYRVENRITGVEISQDFSRVIP